MKRDEEPRYEGGREWYENHRTLKFISTIISKKNSDNGYKTPLGRNWKIEEMIHFYLWRYLARKKQRNPPLEDVSQGLQHNLVFAKTTYCFSTNQGLPITQPKGWWLTKVNQSFHQGDINSICHLPQRRPSPRWITTLFLIFLDFIQNNNFENAETHFWPQTCLQFYLFEIQSNFSGKKKAIHSLLHKAIYV